MIASYRYGWDDNRFVDVFGVDPNLTPSNLEEMVSSKDGKTIEDPEREKGIRLVQSFPSLDSLPVQISNTRYQVPEQLKTYREAVEMQSNAKGRYNGKVAIVQGDVQVPLRLSQGGFYDYLATKALAVPSDMANEFLWANMIPPFFRQSDNESFTFKHINGLVKKYSEMHKALQNYPSGKTVEEILREANLPNSARARYLGCAYLILSKNGKDLTLVQIAKGMAIAPDCIASAGSTPNPDFSQPDFNFHRYLKSHVNEEMEEEFKFGHTEFDIKRIHLFDDEKEMPFCAIEVQTPLTARHLAERIYGDKGAIKEHPALYSVEIAHASDFARRFPVYASIKSVVGQIYSDAHFHDA